MVARESRKCKDAWSALPLKGEWQDKPVNLEAAVVENAALLIGETDHVTAGRVRWQEHQIGRYGNLSAPLLE